MRRQAPPLEAIEAFIVATRAPSFRAAAERLALSPSAFSRRIQALETFVGAPLFSRDGGVAKLSKVGERYRQEVEPAIDAIRRATVDLRAETSGGTLRVVSPQSFAVGWLIPRLASFMSGPAGVQVELKIAHDARDLRRGLADIAVLIGPVRETGMAVEKLVDLDALMVAAPKLADGRKPPRSLDELAEHTRLTVYRPEGIWETWLGNLGYRGPELAEPKRYDSQILVYEAAAAGLGITLASPLLAGRWLREGRLQPCIEQRASIGVSYELVFADAAVKRRRDARAFAAWLRRGLARAETAMPSAA